MARGIDIWGRGQGGHRTYGAFAHVRVVCTSSAVLARVWKARNLGAEKRLDLGIERYLRARQYATTSRVIEDEDFSSWRRNW